MLSENEKIAMFYGAVLTMSSEYAKTNPDKANRLFQFGLRQCIKLYIKDGETNNHSKLVNELVHYTDKIKPEFTQSEKQELA